VQYQGQQAEERYDAFVWGPRDRGGAGAGAVGEGNGGQNPAPEFEFGTEDHSHQHNLDLENGPPAFSGALLAASAPGASAAASAAGGGAAAGGALLLGVALLCSMVFRSCRHAAQPPRLHTGGFPRYLALRHNPNPLLFLPFDSAVSCMCLGLSLCECLPLPCALAALPCSLTTRGREKGSKPANPILKRPSTTEQVVPGGGPEHSQLPQIQEHYQENQGSLRPPGLPG